MDSTVRTLLFSKVENDQSRFLALPASGFDCKHLLSVEIWGALTRWRAVLRDGFSVPVTLLCHLQTGGPVCYIMPDPASSSKEQAPFIRHHKDCRDRNTLMILRVPSPKSNGNSSSTEIEYCLAPLWGRNADQGQIPVFAVYATSHFAVDFLLGRVLHPRRLPVVFDLDETLVKAKTIGKLSDDTIKKNIEDYRIKILSDTKLDLLQKTALLNSLAATKQLMQQDAASLRVYKDTDSITISNGTRIAPEYVECPFYRVLPSGQLDGFSWVTRPIINQEEEGLIFTRIRPEDREQSMVFRIRPYWPEVRTLLTGGLDKILQNQSANAETAKSLIEAFVCTTADYEYAHEVWRVLDVGEAMIPHDKWTKRISAKQGTRKCLAPTLGLPDNHSLVSESGNKSIMPFAIILDDTVSIWEPKAHNQILEVPKWEPYQEWGRVTSTGEAWEKAPAALDMLKIGGFLRDLQKEMFNQLDKQILSLGKNDVVSLDMAHLDASYAQSFAPPPWTSYLLPRIWSRAKPLPLPAKALSKIRIREEKAAEREKLRQEALAAAAPQDPRLAARAARQEQQRAEPVAFNPETDTDVFKDWGKKVTTSEAAPQQQDDEPFKNKRKLEDIAQEIRVDDDDDRSKDDDDVLRERDSNEKGLDSEDYDEEEGPARKKAQLTADHPIVRLSQAAQTQSMHLVYETDAVASGGYLTQIKAGGKRIGFARGDTVDEARRNAAEIALKSLAPTSFSFGFGSEVPLPTVAAGAPAPGGIVSIFDPIPPKFVEFNDALEKLKELFPQSKKGQKVIYSNLSQPGDLVERYRCVVRRDFNSGAPELSAVGEGRNFYQAKREAAAIILRQLGYGVGQYVPIG